MSVHIITSLYIAFIKETFINHIRLFPEALRHKIRNALYHNGNGKVKKVRNFGIIYMIPLISHQDEKCISIIFLFLYSNMLSKANIYYALIVIQINNYLTLYFLLS